jgi:prepilin signal peptidase PulO-like enzyme (type II secretory pathway)
MTWSAVAPFVTGYSALLGLMLGSFINLAADRVPRGESVLTPRSHCRGCGRVLNAIDLLPVVGYMLRRGRCATCQAPIGVGSPVTEVVSGGLMLGAMVWLGVWPGMLVGLALVGVYGAALTGLVMRRRARIRFS